MGVPHGTPIDVVVESIVSGLVADHDLGSSAPIACVVPSLECESEVPDAGLAAQTELSRERHVRLGGVPLDGQHDLSRHFKHDLFDKLCHNILFPLVRDF